MSYFNRSSDKKISNSSPIHGLAASKSGYTLPLSQLPKNRQLAQTTTYQVLQDYGPHPLAMNIEDLTRNNTNFRTTLWTGDYLQLTLMSLLPGEDIGLEVHHNLDQFIRIEQGKGLVKMGDDANTPNFQQTIYQDYAFIIPAGKWHNLINIGNKPLKLYSIYAPTQHPFGTIHQTKAQAEAAEEKQHSSKE